MGSLVVQNITGHNFPRAAFSRDSDDGKTPADDSEITYGWGERASETPVTLVAVWMENNEWFLTLSLSIVFWDVREAMEMVSGWLLASPWLSSSSPSLQE